MIGDVGGYRKLMLLCVLVLIVLLAVADADAVVDAGVDADADGEGGACCDSHGDGSCARRVPNVRTSGV